MNKCLLTIFTLGILLPGISFGAQGERIREVQDLRDIFKNYQDTVTLEKAKDSSIQASLTKAVNQKIDNLRASLEAKYKNIPEGVSVLKYLPKNPVLDGSVDYSKEFQAAVNENTCVMIPGNNDPNKPLIYGIRIHPKNRCGIKVSDGHILVGHPNAVLKRLPSQGPLIHMRNSARLKGVTINGNKTAHWPEFQELGKGDYGVLMGSDCLVEDCLVYDNPGIAFGTYANNNIVRGCAARNTGYIDLKFNATYYQGKWDQWSGDGFYMRGYNNLVMDCQAYDCFRWGYTTCHDNAGGATYMNCGMRNEMWDTYGFIDIEGCHDDKEGTVLIDMKSKQERIVISTDKTMVFGCEAYGITIYEAEDVLVFGCKTHGGGLGVGGWTSLKNASIRGGNNPIVVNNTVIKSGAASGIPNISDWSLSVFSADGKGMAVGNVLKEYQDKQEKGPGMKFDKVQTAENRIEYGRWIIKTLEKTTPTKQKALDEIQKRKCQQFAANATDMLNKLGVKDKIVSVMVLGAEAGFIKDLSNKGEKEKWFIPQNHPGDVKSIQMGVHWDNQYGTYHGHAWYFSGFHVTGDDFHVCNKVYLLFGGVDSECWVYINGRKIGEHKGWDDPFVFSVPKEVITWEATTRNDLTIHVFTPTGLGGVYGYVALVLCE